MTPAHQVAHAGLLRHAAYPAGARPAQVEGVLLGPVSVLVQLILVLNRPSSLVACVDSLRFAMAASDGCCYGH